MFCGSSLQRRELCRLKNVTPICWHLGRHPAGTQKAVVQFNVTIWQRCRPTLSVGQLFHRQLRGKLHREAENRNHFSFTNKSFNAQCNLTKFSTLLVKLIDVIYFLEFMLISAGDVQKVGRRIFGPYVINHDVMKLMIAGHCL